MTPREKGIVRNNPENEIIKGGEDIAVCVTVRTADGRLTAAEVPGPGHREFVITRLYESA